MAEEPETKMSLIFGVNTFDQCPDKQERYHVVDDKGYIRAKYKFGYSAYDHCGKLSDRESDVTFTAIDTRDGSVYGAYQNGSDIEDAS